MGRMILYNHGGSENHGCEALVRTACHLFGKNKELVLLSDAPDQDVKYGIDRIVDIECAKAPYSKLSASYVKAYAKLKTRGDYFEMDILPYLKPIETIHQDDVVVSIGGDNYCYDEYGKYIRLNRRIRRRGAKTVLLGCSLEEKLFDDPAFVEDMRGYDLITARESLTYSLLQKHRIDHIALIPDPAFTLPKTELPLPKGFIDGNTVGLNVSPLVIQKEGAGGVVFENYRELIRTILGETDCAVALIPHVIWEGNDDRAVLSDLYAEFAASGRVVLIEDHNCMELKDIISHCRFFIGARTHATIAAYSTCVPTVVLGYSIKSRGIAKDLFETAENYVVPVESLLNQTRLTEAFRWLRQNEVPIKKNLEKKMPSYIDEAKQIQDLEKRLLWI